MQELESAKIDHLTRCYMKESLAPLLERLVIEDKTFGRPFTVLLLDVDHFKSFNDKYGHLHGDAVLKFFSSSLRLGLEEVQAHIFRFGGDEFVVLFPGKDPHEVNKTALFLRYALRKRPLLIGGKLFNITFSGGIASSRDGKTPEEILAAADKAMYLSKKHGRARSTVYGRIGITKLLHGLGRAGITTGLLVVFAALSFVAAKLYFPEFSIESASRLLRGVPAMKKREEAVTIRLKSGRSFKGVIVTDRPDSVDFLLSMDTGSASVTIKKSDIKEIIKGK